MPWSYRGILICISGSWDLAAARPGSMGRKHLAMSRAFSASCRCWVTGAMCSPLPRILFLVLQPLLSFCRVSGNPDTTSSECLNITGFDLNIYVSKFTTNISRGITSFVFYFSHLSFILLSFQNKISIASSFQGWVILNLSTSPGCLSLLPSYLSNY